MLTDADYAATIIGQEAGNQPYEGRVAVGLVIANRTALGYASDKTVKGTVEHRWAFSGLWAAMDHGTYQQISYDEADADAQALKAYLLLSKSPAWPTFVQAWRDAEAHRAGQPMSFHPGPAFGKLTQKTVLYFNPKITPQKPIWATPQNYDASIFAHDFYHDGGVLGRVETA